MTISVITPALNAAQTIGATLESIARQSFLPVECIVVDGVSTDNTRVITEQFSSRLPLRVISEPDSGVYDAMNKGIRATTGDIVSILNADDAYADSNVFARVVAEFEQYPEVDIVYGDIVFTHSAYPERIVRRWQAGQYTARKLKNGWAMPHPAVFVRRSVYSRLGLFNATFQIAGDYELVLRWLQVAHLHARYLPVVLARMRSGGISGRSLRQRVRGWQELKRAWRVNGLKPPFALILRRVFFKLKQFYV